MSRLLTLVGVAAFALGVVLVARPQAAPAPVVPITPVPSASSARAASASPSATPVAFPAIPDGYRVTIARLGIDLPIQEGDVERDAVEQRTPEGSAFHLPGTGIPGSGVNCYIYAHARTGMFLSLWNVRAGDDVIITRPDGVELHYIVSEVHPRVPYDDVSWAAPTTPEHLTLQTSTGPNPGDPRFVVIARPA
ncbi:MAG TPA: sortase [Candidatus Limnocylindria bacterium]